MYLEYIPRMRFVPYDHVKLDTTNKLITLVIIMFIHLQKYDTLCKRIRRQLTLITNLKMK